MTSMATDERRESRRSSRVGWSDYFRGWTTRERRPLKANDWFPGGAFLFYPNLAGFALWIWGLNEVADRNFLLATVAVLGCLVEVAAVVLYVRRPVMDEDRIYLEPPTHSR